MLASPGYVAQVNANLCAACGACTDYCQLAAISVDDEFARIDAAAYMGCGVCVTQCRQEAIDLVRDPIRREAPEIQTLIADVARSAQGCESRGNAQDRRQPPVPINPPARRVHRRSGWRNRSTQP